jgi:hypothetical protein
MMAVVFPPGVKPGCTVRNTKVGDACPVASEVIDIKPRDAWHEFIGGSNVRQFRPWTLYQDGIGSCGAETLTAAIGYKTKQQNAPSPKLNPWSMYWKTSGGRDQGSAIDDNLEYARDHGLCPESVWPRYGEDGRVVHPWYEEPSEEAKHEARNHRILEYCDCVSLLHVGSCLCDNISVAFGWQGHACLLVELISETEAVYDNWWRRGWGGRDWREIEDGFGVIDLREIDFRYGAFGILSTTIS